MQEYQVENVAMATKEPLFPHAKGECSESGHISSDHMRRKSSD